MTLILYYTRGLVSGLMTSLELVVALPLPRTLALRTFHLGALPDERSYWFLKQWPQRKSIPIKLPTYRAPRPSPPPLECLNESSI